MNFLEEIKKLRKKNVHICFSHDLYEDGTNCNFSIIFGDIDHQTGWFGDDHEFGETEDVMLKAIETANYFLSNPDFIKWYFFSAKETVTEEGLNKWKKSQEVREKIHKFIF
jgi:hypothetical protein